MTQGELFPGEEFEDPQYRTINLSPSDNWTFVSEEVYKALNGSLETLLDSQGGIAEGETICTIKFVAKK